MALYELLQTLLDVNGIATATECVPLKPGDPSSCPASVFHAVTAAFATQGYWVQADMLHLINNTGFRTWAILIYTIAAISGIISMAMGFPPKLYLWFFMGPGIFHWLVQDTIPVAGVRWNVGPEPLSDPGRQERAQREVWKLAEPGLSNTNLVRKGYGIESIGGLGDLGLGGGLQFSSNFGKVRVANLFVWFDALISDLVEWFVEWSGVFNMSSSGQSIFSSGISSLPSEIVRTATAGTLLDSILSDDSDRSDDMHWLLSNLKWQIVTDITAAKLHNVNLRRAFIDFLASECGEAFRRGIDEAKYTAAATARGANIPESVFIRKDNIPIIGSFISDEYQVATQYLATTSIPAHEGLKEILTKDSTSSFTKALPFVTTSKFKNLNLIETIRCDQLLYILVQGFRWEAGHIYYQMISGLPAGVSPATMLYTLFYGWPIHDFDNSIESLFDLGFLSNTFTGSSILSAVSQYTPEGQANFFSDLILVHLIRNELALAPTPYDVRQSGGGESIQWMNEYQRTVGSRSKFGEVYTWSLLIPYVQGVLLYLLAVGYPFCCMLILVPGWHKIIFTWMTFWVWVKLWDAGFAIVMVLERSIWAMIGSRSDAVKLFSKVWTMQKHATVEVNCPNSFLLFSAQPPFGVCSPGVIPDVSVAPALDPSGYITWYDTMKILDKSMTLGAAMDLDLSNSYYIYIMAALYFAVPAVTGQLVLGAKAGAASLATQAISGTAQESGRGLGSAYTGSEHGRLGVMKEQAMQSANLAGQRESGYATAALNHGNQGMMARQQQAAASTRAQALGQMSRVSALSERDAVEGLGVMSSGLQSQIFDTNAAGTSALEAARGSATSVAQFQRAASNGSQVNSSTGNAGANQSGNPSQDRPGGNTASQLGNAAQTAQNTFAPWANAAAQRTGFYNSAGAYAISSAERGNQVGYDAAQGQNNVNALGYGMYSAGLDVSAGRAQEAAQYAGASRAGALGAQMSHSLGGTASARGIIGGQFGAPLPTQGAAASGALGREAKDAFGFSSGGYFSWANGMMSEMNAGYGSEAISSRYQSSSGNLGTLWQQSMEYGDSFKSNSGINMASGLGYSLNIPGTDRGRGFNNSTTPQSVVPGIPNPANGASTRPGVPTASPINPFNRMSGI